MALNHTESFSWTVEDLIGSLSETPKKKSKIIIPKFQRTLVWKKEQQKSFIDSIKKGFPVGAVLLYKASVDQYGITQYNLIDGLQRSTALNQYLKAPTQFFDETNIGPDLVDEIHDIIHSPDNEIEKDSIVQQIVNWITKLTGFEEDKGFSSFNLSLHLSKILDLKLSVDQHTELTNKFIPVLKAIKEEANIYQFTIPVLIYNGAQSNLPIIFERLNSKGTQLSKYQIYAATWTNYKNYQIANRKIIEGIKNKYDLLLEEGYEVENYDNSPKFFTSEFTTFEYLFGLGKYLTQKFDYLFSSNSNAEQEDSVGFNIMNICLGLQFENMNRLPEFLEKYELSILENAIVDSIDFVYDCLKGHISLKMNKRSKITIVHSELQIVSMIGKAFHSKYENNLEIKENWSSVKLLLERNLTYHYLYDIIRGHWRGSGDSKAYSLAFSERYEMPIKRSSWDSAFSDWLEYDLSKKEKTRVSIKDVAILFYKYLYSYSLSAYEEISKIEYDIEHIIPVDKLKEIAGESGIPISAYPNLCLLDSNLNRKKGSLTFYQYFQKLVDQGEITEDQAVYEIQQLEKYTHTDREDLQFVETNFSVENYKQFLQNRFTKVVELFYNYNGIDQV